MTTPLLILIAGPYRSGTDGDPALIAANLARLEEASWPIFRAGHVPIIGEWVALPVLREAGSAVDPDSLFRYFNMAHCLCSLEAYNTPISGFFEDKFGYELTVKGRANAETA